MDLARHLCDRWSLRGNAEGFQLVAQVRALEEKRVMELGCGHGLPGVLAAKVGMHVDFQVIFMCVRRGGGQGVRGVSNGILRGKRGMLLTLV